MITYSTVTYSTDQEFSEIVFAEPLDVDDANFIALTRIYDVLVALLSTAELGKAEEVLQLHQDGYTTFAF